ncbi:GNAT family N-acetyltransferase [Actinoplanes derwentensis]|uniref:Acetyltransferase (GNAT) family protein n=1 Tax=Actinoplanes derwentensis TaxID=113562 RepID=A0A1H1TSJ8_9ACTN|nr:GNAT family N-acetyltransferase [Actinoplanes derwentensis]GID85124.1 N-acetyltransferase [Actinoplanes derwentensis]SDS63295.1 Acetyltransferase (GNAT) family protein [Actinoplanes derwentensis]
MTPLTIRPAVMPDDLDTFNSFSYVLNAEIAKDLAAGRRRPEWLWLALRGDQVTARAAWWSRPGDEHPLVMDILDVADGHFADGVSLVRAALPTPAPEFTRFVAPDWQRSGDDTWMRVLEECGAKLFVERLRLHWEPGTPIAEPSGRLAFRAPRDADELIEMMTLVLDGSLDAHSRDDLTRMSPRECAEEQYRSELERYSTPRDWWRVAELPGGEPVGFVIPAHNGYNPIIAYIAVLPGHRGRGLVDDILAEGVRVLAGQGVPRIRAATDVGNVPMAAAFARAGFRTFERQVDLTW